VLEEIRETEFKGDHGELFNISFTAGLAEYPQDGVTIESLVHVADQKLYVGKNRGRNTIISD
jgi:PleD family two-component response regulator